MHNLTLIVALAEQRRRQCPCGAVADRHSGLCRKCQDRNTWRRKTNPARGKTAHGKTARRRIGHHARKVARLFFDPSAETEG